MLKNNRSFAKMFAAYGLSAFGDYLDFMAVSILLGFIWKADAMTIALLPLTYALPSIVLGQWAGTLADRRNRRDLMIAADLIRALLTAALLFAPNAGMLLALIAARSAARVFHYPAQQAMTRAVVSPDQLLQATSLNGAVFQLSKILGPLLGASVTAAFSPSGCLAVNAVCYLLSAALLIRIPAEQGKAAPAEAKSSERAGARPAWRDSWRILLRNRILWVSIAFSLLGLAGIQLVDAQITVLLREIAPNRPALIGWLVTAIGAGGLAGVAWLRRFRQLSAYGWLLGGGLALIGGMFAAAGMFRPETPLWFMLAVSFAGGIGTGFTSTGMNYILQKETPPEAIGRISGIYDSLSSVVFVAAPLTGGALIGWWGASVTFLSVGLFVGCVGLAGMALRRALWGTAKPIGSSPSLAAE
ncbi:MFS transporter [Cohnella caldifontis]|uniref:MFS transporter n=1 Tax=Cohnella caldifontis TaxID=3027471 RepID=UPI0023EC0AB8|nr:MFS transporter [Cohnella sp. YIM B05605]